MPSARSTPSLEYKPKRLREKGRLYLEKTGQPIPPEIGKFASNTGQVEWMYDELLKDPRPRTGEEWTAFSERLAKRSGLIRSTDM